MTYRVGEFSALTGVTVRALQHYDRLGLLTPSRTVAGHRVYSAAHQQRLRHILALRRIGMSLQRIAETLDASPARLPAIFEAQRASLERSQIGIGEAISALRRVEVDPQTPDSLLDRLATAVDMQDALEEMRSFFSDEAWARWGERYFHDWPPPAWRSLLRDAGSLLHEDPDCDRARALVGRWRTQWRSDTGSDSTLVRSIREEYGRAWIARHRWPRELQRRYAEYKVEAITRFIGDATLAAWRREGLIHSYTYRG